jgi:hypothetical protein
LGNAADGSTLDHRNLNWGGRKCEVRQMAIPTDGEPNKRCAAAAISLSIAHILTVVGTDYQVYPLDGLQVDNFFLVNPCCFSIACCSSPSNEESVPFRGNLRRARSDHFCSTDASCFAVLLVWN